MLRYDSHSYNFLVLKKAKNAFLVRYDSRQIAFLTLIPFKWCGIYIMIDDLLRYDRIRYGALRINTDSLLYKNVSKPVFF